MIHGRRTTRLEPAWTKDAGDYVTTLGLASTGVVLAAGTAAGHLLLMEPWSGRELVRSVAHPGGLTSLAFAPAGDALATAGRDGHVRLWGLDGQPRGALGAGTYWLERIAWSPGGGTLAVAAGREVLLLEPDLTPRARSGPRPSTVSGLAWSQTPEQLWSSELGGLRRWDPVTGAELSALACPGSLLGVTVTRDASLLASPGQDTTVRIFRSGGGVGQTLQGARAKPTALAWSADGRTLAHGGSESVLVWAFEPGTEEALTASSRAEGRALPFHQARVGAVAFAPDKDLLATGAADGSLAVWSLAERDRRCGHAMLAAAPSQLLWAVEPRRLLAATASGQVLALEA